MLRELIHFARHAPGVIWNSTRMSHAELFDLLVERAERAGMAERRAQLTAGLAGDVLEIGCGTGRMFPYYEEGVTLVALEPAARFLRLARPAAEKACAVVRLLAASGERLPFSGQTFDAVIMADVLCSVGNTPALLAEVHRVLKPKGELRVTAHVISTRAVPRLLMNLFNPLWRLYNRQGCNMNRDTESDLRRAGFALHDVQHFQIFAAGLPAFPSLFLRATGLR